MLVTGDCRVGRAGTVEGREGRVVGQQHNKIESEKYQMGVTEVGPRLGIGGGSTRKRNGSHERILKSGSADGRDPWGMLCLR